MSMEMNIGQVVASIQAVNAILYEGSKERKLPFKIKHRLTTIKKELSTDLDLYEKHRQVLVQKYGDNVEREGGESAIEVKDPEKLEQFYKEIEEVLKTVVEHNFKKLTQEELQPIEDIEIDITEMQLQALFTYLVEKEE
jgi:hypothetical protein